MVGRQVLVICFLDCIREVYVCARTRAQAPAGEVGRRGRVACRGTFSPHCNSPLGTTPTWQLFSFINYSFRTEILSYSQPHFTVNCFSCVTIELSSDN